MYRKKSTFVQSVHSQNFEGWRLHAKLRALNGSCGTVGVGATSIRHQQTVIFPSISNLDNCTECCALSRVVDAVKAVSVSRLLEPFERDILTAFPFWQNTPDYIFITLRLALSMVLSQSPHGRPTSFQVATARVKASNCRTKALYEGLHCSQPLTQAAKSFGIIDKYCTWQFACSRSERVSLAWQIDLQRWMSVCLWQKQRSLRMWQPRAMFWRRRIWKSYGVESVVFAIG